MILAFKFVNGSKNGVLEKILKRLLDESECFGIVTKEEDQTVLYAESENSDFLESLANKLSVEVPHSIFLKEYNVEQVDEIPTQKGVDFDKFVKNEMPPCPKCLREVDDLSSPHYYNIFTHCDVCGYNVLASDVTFSNFAKEWKLNADASHKEIFEQLAQVLHNGGNATLMTMNGEFTVAALNEKNLNKFAPYSMVVSDVHMASSYFELQKGEVLALGSMEKPKIRLRKSQEFSKEFSFVKTEFFYVKLPDDMVLYLLMKEMEKYNNSIVYLSKTINPKNNIKFYFQNNRKNDKHLDVVITEEGEAVISSGDRSILPLEEKGYGKNALGVSGQYIVLMHKNRTLISRREETDIDFDEIEEMFVAKDDESFNFNNDNIPLVKFEKRHGAFFSILGQQNLMDKKTAGVYISKENSSAIMLHNKKFGLVDLVHFDFDYLSINEIFSEIKSMNESGEKLIKNFTDKYPEFLNMDKKIKSSGSDIMTLFGTIALLLGYSKSIDDGSKIILDNAAAFRGKKGPRIDYKLKEERFIDPLWSIRTAMSFKLAGIDELTLSFGVIESFCEFLSNTIDDAHTDMELDGVALCGSLFEEKKILQKTHLIIGKNHPVFFNKVLPLDEANAAYGALLLTI